MKELFINIIFPLVMIITCGKSLFDDFYKPKRSDEKIDESKWGLMVYNKGHKYILNPMLFLIGVILLIRGIYRMH
jgi:hypothetical protein